MATDLARKTAEIASRDVGVVTEHGQNTGHFRIWAYQQAAHITPGQPYCAAAVTCWVKEAAAELGVKPLFLGSASAMRLLALNPNLAFGPDLLEPDDLPCVFVIDHGRGKGHTGLIVGMDDNGNLQTIEANTNGVTDPGQPGSREGQGVRALATRKVTDLAGVIAIA